MHVDLFIDWENKKIINVLPYAIHCEGLRTETEKIF